MVKLVRVERTCEQTGHNNCPLAPCQRPEASLQHEATAIVVVSRPAEPNTPVFRMDPRYKVKLGILFVKPFRPDSR